MNKSNIDYNIYLVTDRSLLMGKDLYESIEQAIIGGASVVQLREKDINTSELYSIAVKIKNITTKYNIPLIINDRADIAQAVDADGLHIGQEDIPLTVARKILGQDKIIGVSAANLQEALQAEQDGADYLGVGAVFPTATKANTRAVSINQLAQIKAEVHIPVVAIGGIGLSNVEQLRPSCIDGIAVVSAILAQPDIREAARDLTKAWRKKL